MLFLITDVLKTPRFNDDFEFVLVNVQISITNFEQNNNQLIYKTRVKIYTKTGDDGTTSLQGNIRIKKSDLRIKAYGTVDELNAFLGIIVSKLKDKELVNTITAIQNDLFVLGADLSNTSKKPKNRITIQNVKVLEQYIDSFESELPNIAYFILPGGTEIAANFHFARAIARRAESLVVSLSEEADINKTSIQYLNRLSDLLFVISRKINKDNGVSDIPWKTNTKQTQEE